jgi:hypothetical protein
MVLNIGHFGNYIKIYEKFLNVVPEKVREDNYVRQREKLSSII